MRYQLASDLHIEYFEDVHASSFIKKDPNTNILILTGDIGSLYRLEQLTNFLKELSDFEKIIYVPGNHEFYTLKNIPPKTFNQLISDLYSLEQKIENLIILNNSSIIIDDTIFHGCTLWSNIGDNFLPKFRVRIYGFNNQIYQQQYNKNLNFLTKAFTKYSRNTNLKKIVITHYPPINLVQNIKNKFPYLYSNNLNDLISLDNMCIWHFGHIHKNFNFDLNNVKLITNQKGREKDNVTDYHECFVIKTT